MFRMIAVLAAVLMLVAPAYSKEKPGKGKGHGKESEAQSFDGGHRSLITDYYRSRPGGLPPGLAKRQGDLPPGLEKQLRRNGALPPGLEKHFAPFPAELETRLPPCPPDVRRGTVGGVAVMYNSRTGLIVDAFAIVGR